MAPLQTDWVCLLAFHSDLSLVNSHKRATCPGPIAVVTLQIVSQGELWLIGDEEEEGSDKSVALNCHWSICSNLLCCRRLKVGEDLGRRSKRGRHLLTWIQSLLLSFLPSCPIWGGSRSEAVWEAAVKFSLTVKCKPPHWHLSSSHKTLSNLQVYPEVIRS